MANKDKMTFDQACKELQISEDELEQLVANGQIAGIKEGDTVFFKPETVVQYKKNRKTEPTIILADEDMDLLEGMDELDLGEKASPAKAAAHPAKAEINIELPEGEEMVIETRKAGEPTPVAPVSADDTVLNLEGLLEDDGSEGTTPIPGGDAASKMIEESSDITVEGNVSDETLLDTDLLEIGEEEDSFKLDPAGEESAPTEVTEATLLRGGGARVMQMKRKKGHPVLTALLAATAVALLFPLGIYLNLCFVVNQGETPAATKIAEKGGKEKDSPYKWIKDSNLLGGVIETIADSF